MHQRENIIERLCIVEEHIGVHAIYAGGIGARALALVLVDIDPALVIGLFHNGEVLFAEGF